MDGLISLIFFIIELIITIAVIFGGRQHIHWKTIVGLLIFLQVYQLAEFLLCIGVDQNIVGRIAFASITFLPPLGYYFSQEIVGWEGEGYAVPMSMGSIIVFYYVIVPDSIALRDCNPFYAVYDYPFRYLYGIYYFGVILASIYLLVTKINTADQIQQRQSLFLLGYLGFLIPMAITIVIDPETIGAVPSIMCKYAITLAIILGYMAFKT